MNRISLLHGLLLLILATACQTAVAPLPPVEKIYTADSDVDTVEIDAGEALSYQSEINAIAARLGREGKNNMLQPAAVDSLNWLQQMNVPAPVRQFYAAAEPSAPVEIDGVYLLPIAQIMQANTEAVPGIAASQHQLIVIAQTISGDAYALDTNAFDTAGQTPVYLINHERVGEEASLSQIQEQSRLAAASFQEFLSQFSQGQLTDDFDQPGGGDVLLLTAETTTYHDGDGRFQISYPTSWIIIKNESPDEVHFANPSLTDEMNPIIATVIVQGPVHDLLNVARAAEETIRRQGEVENFQLVSQMGVEVNGLPGLERKISYTIRGTAITQHTIYLLHPDHTFVLSLVVPEENAPGYAPLFDAFIRGFQTP